MYLAETDLYNYIPVHKAKTLMNLIRRKGCRTKNKKRVLPMNTRWGHTVDSTRWMTHYDLEDAANRLRELIKDPVIDIDSVGSMEMYQGNKDRHYRNAIVLIERVIVMIGKDR